VQPQQALEYKYIKQVMRMPKEMIKMADPALVLMWMSIEEGGDSSINITADPGPGMALYLAVTRIGREGRGATGARTTIDPGPGQRSGTALNLDRTVLT
jgi:hypothetical protein